MDLSGYKSPYAASRRIRIEIFIFADLQPMITHFSSLLAF